MKLLIAAGVALLVGCTGQTDYEWGLTVLTVIPPGATSARVCDGYVYITPGVADGGAETLVPANTTLIIDARKLGATHFAQDYTIVSRDGSRPPERPPCLPADV